ncbi:MAG: hypothetical protein mread185_000082 [Mycoplasmataceae bacterium]|nr:MAG: hypothetical protein mread185_000082 [Mycoplasmataceae bacterium]
MVYFALFSIILDNLPHIFFLQKSPYQVNFSDRAFSNVWAEAITNKSHPHQKPVQLLKRLILALTQEGDLVVDPCAGSFITLTACQSTNRNFLGCDLTINKLQKFYEKN